MRILLVSSKFNPEYSGSGYRAEKTYSRLEKKFKINYNVISNSQLFQGNKYYKINDVEIYRIASPIKIYNNNFMSKNFSIIFSFIWEIYYSFRFLKKNFHKYDLLHTFGNTFTIGFFTYYFSKYDKPVIRELCNELKNPYYPIQFKKIFKKIFSKNNNQIIAISKKLEIIAKNHNARNVWLRPNPIDEKKFFIEYQSKYLYRKKLTKFKKNHKVITCIANFTENKNQIFLIDLMKKLPENYRMILNGPLKPENKKYFDLIGKKIKKMGLEKKIDLKFGFVSNFDQYIKLSDVFLVPSISEGLCTPILESQACGVPVVSNFIKDVTDKIIIEGKGGFFIPLDCKRWAIKITDATKIDKNLLIENSSYLINNFSTKTIDKLYFKKMKKLI